MATPTKTATTKPAGTKAKKEIVVDNSPAAKEARFKKIAGRRTKKIIVTIANLGNTSNKSVYSYTDEHVEYIFAEIEKQLKLSRAKFAAKAEAAKKPDFELK